MSKFNVGNTKASKLTGVEVMEIREKYASGLYTMNRLAREYHVTRNTISDIVHGVTWQDLPGVTPQHVIDDAAARSMRKLDAMMAETASLEPATGELDDATLAAMQQAVQDMPKPEFLKPSDDVAARMAAYGARVPTDAPPPQLSKPALQAQAAEAAQGAEEALPGIANRQPPSATGRGDDLVLDGLLDQLTEEAGK